MAEGVASYMEQGNDARNSPRGDWRAPRRPRIMGDSMTRNEEISSFAPASGGSSLSQRLRLGLELIEAALNEAGERTTRSDRDLFERIEKLGRRARAALEDGVAAIGESAAAVGEILSGVGPDGAPKVRLELPKQLDSLTSRQREVLGLLAEGLPNKLIAYRLGICEATAKAHVGAVLRKMNCHNRGRAIALLAQTDLGKAAV